MKVSYNDSHIFATGQDNSITIIEIKDKQYQLKIENYGEGISTKDFFLYNEDKLFKQREEIE